MAKVSSTVKGAASAGAGKGQEALNIAKAHLLPLPEEAAKTVLPCTDPLCTTMPRS